MKIFTLTASEDWFPDKYAVEYSKHSSHEIDINNYKDSNVVWMIASYQWRAIKHEFLQRTPVVCSIHHTVTEKFNKQEFLERDKIVNVYHVPCRKSHDQIRSHTDKPIEIIGYWYESSKWFPLDRQKCKQKFNLSENDFTIGSFQRDTEGSDLKSPKLEKGPDRFCDYVDKINKNKTNVHVLLNGWRRQYVINRLNKSSIKYTYLELPEQEVVRDMYGACDLYVVGSRCEGGPQSLIEAAGTKTPIISTDVGMAKSILSKKCIIDIENETYYPTQEDIEENYNNVKEFEVTNQVKLYDALMKKAYENYL